MIVGYRGYEAITAARQRFNVARFFWIVSERSADFFDTEVYAALEIDKRIVTPETTLNLITRHDLTGGPG
jgi:hypothetical protein